MLVNGEQISEREVRIICEKAKEIFIEENNVQVIPAPVTIWGDIHGQFYDLLELFRTGGDIPGTSYIFMGDMVDRGYHSVETFLLLLLLKIKFAANITILRGNHESRIVTQQYGFYDEIMKKYRNSNPWKYFTEVFDCLGIAALVEGKILCLHGGLSPEIKTIDQMRTIDRFQEIPTKGPFTDIMWSDPEEIETWSINPRMAGWLFGSRVTSEFNRINDLELICRAHQLVQDGYKIWFKDQNLVTVWSAPNYCYRCGNNIKILIIIVGNVASILQVDEELDCEYKIFYSQTTKSGKGSKRSEVPYFL